MARARLIRLVFRTFPYIRLPTQGKLLPRHRMRKRRRCNETRGPADYGVAEVGGYTDSSVQPIGPTRLSPLIF